MFVKVDFNSAPVTLNIYEIKGVTNDGYNVKGKCYEEGEIESVISYPDTIVEIKTMVIEHLNGGKNGAKEGGMNYSF